MLTPQTELYGRIEKVKHCVYAEFPGIQGFFIFSRINIYYFSGTLASGTLYIPMQGEPILFVRKGQERAKAESPLTHIYSYKSYSEIENICAGLGCPLSQNSEYGMEESGITWQLAKLFLSKIKAFANRTPINIDTQIKTVRSIKSPYELEKIREAGKRQSLVLEKILPAFLRQAAEGKALPYPAKKPLLACYDPSLAEIYPQHSSLSELNIAKLCIQLYTELGHGFLCRMSAHGEEAFYGHIACGENLNKAHYYNGAMGFDGLHPALPCLGSEKIWQKGEPLCVDMLFNYQGYHTDKTQCYFRGTEKELPGQAQKAYECCLEIQEIIIKKMKQGSIPEELWLESLAAAKRFGFAENFMGFGQNSVPFLGHGIGLSVDEFPVLAKGFKNPLQNGMVIACEPKIGIPGFGMIGIENTFELTEDTVTNLTSSQNGIICIA